MVLSIVLSGFVGLQVGALPCLTKIRTYLYIVQYYEPAPYKIIEVVW